VALIPFPTDLMGRFGDETASVVIYAGVIGVAALGGWSLFSYARYRRLLDPRTPPDAGFRVAARSVSISVVFLASIPVALWSPAKAPYVWLGAIPLRYVWLRWAARRTG
jgi:hypothetical protein